MTTTLTDDTPLVPYSAERAYVRGLYAAADECVSYANGLVPSDAQYWMRTTLPDAIRALAGTPPDLTNPSNIPFGQLPRATQEAMVIAHVLDGAEFEYWHGVMWIKSFPHWASATVYRVVQP